MCKTSVETYISYANICKHEHENNKTRLWCKIMPKNGIEHTKGNKRSYFYLYSFGDLAQRSFQGGFMCALRKLFGNLPSWESIMS
jgi:hypothetical protein